MGFPQASKEQSQVTSMGILGALKRSFCPREEKISAFTPNDQEEGS